MDKIDRLIVKATSKTRLFDRLEKDNVYLGKTDEELLDCLRGENYRAPEMYTSAWDKFMYALMHARPTGGLKE